MLKRPSDFFEQDLSKASNVDKFTYVHTQYKTRETSPSEEKTVTRKYPEPKINDLNGNLRTSHSLQGRALQGRKIKIRSESKNQRKCATPPHISVKLSKPRVSTFKHTGKGDTVRALSHLQSIEFLAKELNVKIYQCYENYPEHYRRRIKILSNQQHQAMVKYLKNLLGKNEEHFAGTKAPRSEMGPPPIPQMQSIKAHRLYLRRLIFLPQNGRNPGYLREIFKIVDQFEESYRQVTQQIEDLKKAVSFQKRARSHSKYRYRRRALLLSPIDTPGDQTKIQTHDAIHAPRISTESCSSSDPSD